MAKAPPVARRSVFKELVLLWLGTLLAIRVVVELHRGAGAPDWILAAVPLLFIYVPVFWCRVRKVDSWSYQLSIPGFRDRAAWAQISKENLKLVLVI